MDGGRLECFEDIEPLHSILIGERIRVTRWHGSGNQSGLSVKYDILDRWLYSFGNVGSQNPPNPAPVHFLGAEPIMHSSEIPELRQAGVEGLNGIPPLRGAGIAVAEVSGRRGQSEIGTVTCWNCSRKITENYACRCGK